MPADVDLTGLLKIDEELKGSEAIKTWADLHHYYNDSSKSLTTAELQRLGVGLAENSTPLEIGILRRIVDRLATVYDRAPTRWLCKEGGSRMKESGPAHKLMVQLYRKSKVDQALRKVDRRRALSRQEIVRYFPSSHKKAVTLRLFGPNQIAREPDAAEPDCIEADTRFALRLSGDVFEYWERAGEGWKMWRVDKGGGLLPDQPFGESGESPYGAELPVQLIHDDFAGGEAWLNPRQSRKSWTVAINAVGNDLWNMITHQSHSSRHFATSDPNATIPETTGPNVTIKTALEDKLTDLTPNPKLKESQDFLEFMLRAWSLSEDLPSEEFQPGRQVLTGAALKVLDRPLMARREAQIPLAYEDEAAGFRKFRAVHNHAAESWGAKLLPDDVELEVEIAAVDYPVDGAAAAVADEARLSQGIISRIDIIQRELNLNRADAISKSELVDQDAVDYPAPKSMAPAPEAPAEDKPSADAPAEEGTPRIPTPQETAAA